MVVGRVERIRFDPKTYQAVVTMKIDEGNEFTADTIASILTSGLLGEVYVGLDVGGDTKMLDDGASDRQDAVGRRAGEADRPVPVRQGRGRRPASEIAAARSLPSARSSRSLAGCAATPSKVDPLEPMNRALYQVHDVLDTNIVKPVAEGYVSVVPQFMRTGFANVFNNIDDLFSAVNGLLQGKPDKAGNDLGRVMINTLFGAWRAHRRCLRRSASSAATRTSARRSRSGGSRRVRTCSFRCSARRRCATAPA